MNYEPKIDFLIVGQGLAGTLIAHFLLLENQSISVIDGDFSGATTGIAAGVINPVTGRRIAKSWRFEEFFPFAKQTYLELEQLLGIPLWHERNILRALPTVFDENEWLRRSAWPEHQPYLSEPDGLGDFEGKIAPAHAWGELLQAAQVDLPNLAKTFRERLVREGCFLSENFDYQQLEVQDEGVVYKGTAYKNVVFCEGAKAIANPWFQHLPFSPTKGELLLVRIPGAGFTKMLKHHIFIVPLAAADLYWVGSTSRFEFEDELPTDENRHYLEQHLREILTIPFEILEHKAGIRPTVSDIRPYLGKHPEHPNLFIFNGLGTKGASLGPFFAKQLTGFILEKNELDKEVDIRRFDK